MALRNYERLETLTPPGTAEPILTPSPLAYALGWIVADAVVGERYREMALDAIPVHHPEHGWDRFLLTRRTACDLRRKEAADSFGVIRLSGDDAPVLTTAGGTVLISLGSLLRQDAEGAIGSLLELIPTRRLPSGDHRRCRHTRAADMYPRLYDLIARLVLDRPGLVAAREIFIDSERIDGAFHPLYLHTAGRAAGFNYDWFGVQFGEHVVYIRMHGAQAIHYTGRNTWASAQLATQPPDWPALKSRIANWLRLDAQADRGTIQGGPAPTSRPEN
jgi:hypothetical protein